MPPMVSTIYLEAPRGIIAKANRKSQEIASMSTNEVRGDAVQEKAPGSHHNQHNQVPMPRKGHGFIHRNVRRLGGIAARLTGKAVLFATVVTALGVASHQYDKYQVENFFAADDEDDDDKDKHETRKGTQRKKNVLLLPLHSLRVVEHRQSDYSDLYLLSKKDKQRTITIEISDLVDVLHAAAADPNICALFGDFDEGMRHPMGYAHVEEVRNAIRVFNESHRVHRDPNVGHKPVFAMPRNGDPKTSYSFGYHYQWNEYFLASAFSNIHLQARGTLNLFGTTVTNTFLRPALDKYGIKAHVFKHGDFKTAPNFLTEKKYTKPHLEMVQSTTYSINNTICRSIENSRSLNFDDVMWQSIFDYGSLTAINSQEFGLVNTVPPLNPLLSLLEANKNEKDSDREKFEKQIGGVDVAYTKFDATDVVPLEKYKTMIDKKKIVAKRQAMFEEKVQHLTERSTAMSMIFSGLGFQTNTFPKKKDKIAVVKVDGTIVPSLSYRIVKQLRKIRKDKSVKCIILRVNSPGGSVTSSEAILEEVKAVGKPVICSMSNTAASGGYYIAAHCEKIFAQPTTLTGSIGVYGIKFDASEWAKSYGIQSSYHPFGSHGAALNPLTPLTKGMRDNIERVTLGIYDYFKNIVATGRGMSIEDIESIAQGRVWTGEQAKEIGLVDAIGGLHRAITYAKLAYTKSDDIEVNYYPPKGSVFAEIAERGLGEELNAEILLQAAEVTFGVEGNDETRIVEIFLSLFSGRKIAEKPHYMLAMDEKSAVDLILLGD